MGFVVPGLLCLSPKNFFLCVTLKGKAYTHDPHTPDKLKQNIEKLFIQ
jgi:hypothetical protein